MLHSPESTVGARSARLAVLKHAAATHVALSGFYEPTTPHHHQQQPQGTTPPASASDVLRELEAHLLHAEQKPKRLGGGWSSSEFGVRSTEDAVHVSVLRREMHALEDRLFSKGDLGQQARSARRIEELEKAEEASRGVESTLQMQLAEVTHSCWRAREENAPLKRRLAERDVEVEQLSAAHSALQSRVRELERQVTVTTAERDDLAARFADADAARGRAEGGLADAVAARGAEGAAAAAARGALAAELAAAREAETENRNRAEATIDELRVVVADTAAARAAAEARAAALQQTVASLEAAAAAASERRAA